MTERCITIAGNHSVPAGNLDFGPWADIIREHPKDMLPVSPDQLQKSYGADMATVLLDDGKIVGGTRFVPLLDSAKKQELNLSSLQLPDIWELGSIAVAKEAMGNGFSRDVNKHLLSSVKERIRNGELLVIGTTKTAVVIRMLWGLDLKDIGNFSVASQRDLPMIAPLTCVCKPPLGTGFQMSQNCRYRISPKEAEEVAQKKRGFGLNPGIPCALFISDIDLARRTDGVLKERFSKVDPSNPQGALVAALKEKGYYK
ncbi:MAG: hypothetical protein AAB662_01480 [Patescibacteria group bacterium]